MFEEQSGQNVLLFLLVKVLNSMLFQGDNDMREMLGEGSFYKELGIYEYSREFKEFICQQIFAYI